MDTKGFLEVDYFEAEEYFRKGFVIYFIHTNNEKFGIDHKDFYLFSYSASVYDEKTDKLSMYNKDKKYYIDIEEKLGYKFEEFDVWESCVFDEMKVNCDRHSEYGKDLEDVTKVFKELYGEEGYYYDKAIQFLVVRDKLFKLQRDVNYG